MPHESETVNDLLEAELAFVREMLARIDAAPVDSATEPIVTFVVATLRDEENDQPG
jgi:hypothetical protein